ncbi:hypothetical protein [Pseudosulfitobacter pseudonitzschiae]|uniref:hypothetical protein n=1 Tax=Pseudosulfitobacter pseudonitzschiae TaxID=1402135 RepID=UPI003B7766FF
MLINKYKYPDVAPVMGNPDPGLSQRIWATLSSRGLLTANMTFSSPLKLNKWDREERLELKALHVSKKPIDGVDEDVSKISWTGADPVHVALQDQSGDLHGFGNVTERPDGVSSYGILTTDRDGNLWLCDATGYDHVTGEEILRPMRSETSPLMAVSEGTPDVPFSLTAQPMIGCLRRSLENVTYLYEDMVPRDEMQEEQVAELDAALAVINERLEEITARRDSIAAIVGRHFTDDALSRLVPDMTQDLNKGLVPAYHDFELAKAYNNTLGDITLRFMDDLRIQGYCAPCPNNGPREVGSMTAWNLWMKGKFEGEDLPFDIQILRHRLNDSPAFAMVEGIIMRAGFEVSDRIWMEEHPGEKKTYAPDEEKIIPAARIPEIFSVAREALLECFTHEKDRIMMMRTENLRSSNDGAYYVLAGSFLKPELALRPEDYTKDPIALPALSAPSYIRHLEIPMPSGKLVMADWFRIDGFQEGIEALCGDDDYDINTAKGLDQRARDYFEKAGIAIVQVGNTSPDAISETDGIWRMGYFDEDHDEFWTDDEKRSDVGQPDISWKTCTDLWANTFADRETVISVLMASEIYGDRSAAGAALDDYIEQSYGANCIDLGVSTLHLYAPTGAGIHKGNFNTTFKASEIEQRDWIDDMYILSRETLTVDPELIEEETWVAAELETESWTPEP